MIETSSIFSDNPLVSFRHNQNIRNILVHNSSQQNCSEPNGTFPCGIGPCKHALSPTPTLSFRPQIHSFSSGTISHASPLTFFIASHAINVVHYISVKLEDLYALGLVNIVGRSTTTVTPNLLPDISPLIIIQTAEYGKCTLEILFVQ